MRFVPLVMSCIKKPPRAKIGPRTKKILFEKHEKSENCRLFGAVALMPTPTPAQDNAQGNG